MEGERAVVMITMEGKTERKVTAGTLQYSIYEIGKTSKISSGSFAYFKCGPHGCMPDEPLSLDLQHPDANESKFTLSWQFQMPYIETQTPQFHVAVTGKDETGPDFSGVLSYNISSKAVLKESMVGDFTLNCSNANFTIDHVDFNTNTGRYEPQALGHYCRFWRDACSS